MRRRKTDLQLATEALAGNDLKALRDVLARSQNSRAMGMGGFGDDTISAVLWNELRKYTEALAVLDNAKSALAKHGLRVP